jgi:signal transduction histidine kinase
MGTFRLLLRNTAIRLSALYILLFSLCAVFLVFYVTSMSERLLQQQARDAVTFEVDAVKQIYQNSGIGGLLQTLERRAHQPGAGLYLIAGPTGEILAGNVAEIEAGVVNLEGWTETSFRYKRFTDDRSAKDHYAVAEVFFLSNGLRILIGQDLDEPETFRVLVRQALVIALGVMGTGAVIIWFVVGRNALKRIDKMSAASRRIMGGDLAQRLPVSGSGDEFDRLSKSLNAMLDRIEMLREGLRRVSDNIAHDLKTPLTRIRNKAAAALGDKTNPDMSQQALTGIIQESEQLIRTFNALLMISRVEAGSNAAELSAVDLSAVASDCVELCEPLAEEAGLNLISAIEPGVSLRGNRELLGQALFNLVDNAIKYASGPQTGQISVSLRTTETAIALSVSDQGPGIPADRRDDVLKRFVRLDESRSKPGTGLGLSLVEAVAKLHGGQLELSDTNSQAETNKGLTVTITLPKLGKD